MQLVMLHAARQLPSWLTYNVGQNLPMSFLKYLTLAILAAAAIVLWRSQVPVIPVALAGSGIDFPEIIASDLRQPTLPRLNERDRFPFIYREAIALVADAISKEGLRPPEYFVELRTKDAGRVLRLSLWHESVVGTNYDVNVRGDPSGKCRTVEFDSVIGVIIKVYGWR